MSPKRESGGEGKVKKVKNLTRKMIRKNLRKMQKLKKHEHFMKKKKGEPKEQRDQDAVLHLGDSKQCKDKPKNKEQKKQKIEKQKSTVSKKELMENELRKQRVKQLRVANKLEDKNIRKIEKQLKLHKRKNKGIPKSFVDDGLDYLLDVCDSEKRSELVKEDFDFADNDIGFEEDFAMVSAKPVNPSSSKDNGSAKKVNSKKMELESEDENDFSDNFEEQEPESPSEEMDEVENEGEEEDEEEHEWEENESMDDEDEEQSGFDDECDPESEEMEDEDNGQAGQSSDDSEDNGEAPEYWEDIYGRLRDEKGNVVQEKQQESAAQSGKYVPPGKRLLSAPCDNTVETEKLKRQMKGLLNRLAEANLPSIVSSIELMYRTHARNTMQQVINTLVMDSLATHILSPERLIMEHCVLIAALHANVGTEVGAQFLEAVVRRFDARYQTDGEESKETDNLLLIVSHLYNFGVVSASLLVDILNKLAERFIEKDIELVLIILRSIGFALRKDDPVALKSVILTLQSKATSAGDMTSRVRFMLDILLAIRNNNMSKIPNYDPSHTEHMRKILRNNLIRKGLSVSKMNISYGELLVADQRGRWWVVGSAWVGQGPKPAQDSESREVSAAAGEPQFSAELLELARKQRMNTDVRRNIFCIIMSAEDYIEAFDRLLRLGLKPQQEREIVYVAIDCVLHEKAFNAYYAHLLLKLCRSHRRFQIATQFALWDRFQDMASLSQLQMAHLAKLVVHLVMEQGQTLAVLKVIQFAEMDRTMVRFLRHVLLGILLHQSEAAVQTAFQRIANQSKLNMLRGGLHLFMHHFVLRNAEKIDNAEELDQLRQRIRMVEQVLNL